MKKQLLIAVVGAALAVPFAAQAQEAFVGVSVGNAKQKVSFDGTSDSDSKTGYKVYGGYNFTKNFGVEAGYADFGKFSEDFVEGGIGGTASYKSHSLYLAAKGTLPLGEQFSLFAKAGVAANRAKVSMTFGGLSESASESNTAPYFGVGAAYNITKALSLVAEYENFGKVVKEDGLNVKADMFSVGLRFNF